MAPKKRTKGFTLVEVVVVAGLISLVIGITAALVLSSFNVFARSTRMDHGKQLGLAVYDFYESRLRAAADVHIGGTDPGGEYLALTVAGSHVVHSGTAIYDESIYNGAQVRVTVEALDTAALGLAVEVYDRDGVIFAKDSALRLITMDAAGKAVTAPPGPITDPVIYYIP